MSQTTDVEVVYKNDVLANHFSLTGGNVLIGTTPLPNGFLDSNIPLYLLGSQNAYFGMNAYNFSNGSTASCDIVVNNANGGTTASGTYADFGIVGAGNTDANYAVFDKNAGYVYSQSNNFYVSAGTSGTVFISAGGFSSKGKVGLSVDNVQNVIAGTGAIGSAGTAGFLWIRGGAGAPTGTPQSISGMVPLYYDTTNNNFYVYNSSWKKALTGGTWA